MERFTEYAIIFVFFGSMFLFSQIWSLEGGGLEGVLAYCSPLVATYLFYKTFTWAKTLLVRYKIKSMVDMSAASCISYLNKFLDDKHELDYRREEKNVEFILNDLNLCCRNYYFEQKDYTIRQAIVNESLYFDFELFHHLSYYDESENFCDRPLHLKTSSFEYEYEPLFNWDEDSARTTKKATIFELTEFGVTFYKMLAAISKKCDGKKSIYSVAGSYRYCRSNDRAFEKLEEQKFYKTSY